MSVHGYGTTQIPRIVVAMIYKEFWITIVSS